MDSPLHSASRRWGYSRIGLKVFGAFLVVTLATLLVAVSAWLAFSHVSERMQDISEHQLPVISKAAHFAETGGLIIATAPRLLTASSSWEQESIWVELETQMQQLETLLPPEPAGAAASAGLPRPVVELLASIRRNLQSLNENVSQGFDLRRLNRERSESLRWTHAGFLDEIEPILEDSRFNTQVAMERLVSSENLRNAAQVKQSILHAIRIRDVLMQVNADANLAVGLTLRGASQQTAMDISHTLQYLGEIEDRLRESLLLLQTEESTISLRQAVDAILKFSGGDDSLPGLRLKELGLQQRNMDLLNESKDLIRELKRFISEQVSRSETAALQASAQAKRSVERGRALLVVMLMLGLLVAFVVGWFYVGRNLLGRLNRLRNHMAAIATGNLEVEIDDRGSDEITEMAKALVVFRNTAIQVENANAQSIIDNALVGLVSTDDRGIIEFFNPNAGQLFGIEDAQVIGRRFDEVFLEQHCREVLDLEGLADTAVPQVLEMVGRRQDGSQFPLDLSLGVYHRRQSRKFLLTLVDATERHEAQAILEQRIAERTADLQSANQRLVSEVHERQRTEAELRSAHQELIQATKLASLGQLSASIVHELNQPLSAIRYSAHNALQLLELDRGDEARTCLEKTEKLADKMAKIINHLKVFSRRAADVLEPVNLTEVINSALSLFGQRIRRMDCRLVWDESRSLPEVLGDQIRLEQVIVNLLGNALDAMEGTQQPQLVIDSHEDGERLILRVCDSGTGMSDEVMAQMFDPFFTTKATGQGLGMSISQKIIREFGGELKVESQPGQGTRIHLTLKHTTI
ncbi:ATP-binding protein [Marinobacterium aestuariivivens]|uniref:histidine kinase n=1 Tax=Marinobacterium aestuariivivens TaxID=1698799 RepID=A0ABW1ZZJ0_9GAMM